MEKTDLKKKYRQFYNPSSITPAIVDIPEFQYLMIDGIGMDFGDETSQDAIQALFGVAFKIKFLSKKERGIDYVVMPLEGLWWAEDMNDFINGNRDKWCWTYMIMQPEFVASDLMRAAIEEVKKSKTNKALERLRLEGYQEGISAQIMHIGPFAEEHPNIMKVHQFIEDNQGTLEDKRRKHHEIYLSDFRKTAPEKMKTILRQPFQYKGYCRN
ncbi:MAG TPA: hypothetical protein DDW65_08430 [Firmicutes bacterium]|jgi:hypothetical protein|nr:hypothetical protein [Bacillota bacterium]